MGPELPSLLNWPEINPKDKTPNFKVFGDIVRRLVRLPTVWRLGHAQLSQAAHGIVAQALHHKRGFLLHTRTATRRYAAAEILGSPAHRKLREIAESAHGMGGSDLDCRITCIPPLGASGVCSRAGTALDARASRFDEWDLVWRRRRGQFTACSAST